MDKYAAELEKATKEATFIPADLRTRIVGFIFLGATQGKRGTIYYYRDPLTDEYYYESEFDREMRLLIKKNKFKNYRKK